MQTLFEIILPVFVVVGFGYVASWRGLFSEDALDGLVRFTQNFAIPCLLFRAISQIDIGATINVPLLVSYYLGAFASFFVGFFGSRILFARNPADAVAIGFCCMFSNTILLGLPITERAYGPEALAGNYAVIAFHAPLCYMLGVTSMEIVRSRSSGIREKTSNVLSAMFRNPFVIGIALGFVVNIANLQLPSPVISSVDLIAQAALPAALFGLGGILVQYRPAGDLNTILMVCAVSLLLHPAIVWCVGKALVIEQEAFRSAVITSSMAPGVNTYIFANMYGAARRVAASSVLVATAISSLTIWFWLIMLT